MHLLILYDQYFFDGLRYSQGIKINSKSTDESLEECRWVQTNVHGSLDDCKEMQTIVDELLDKCTQM